MIAKLLREPFDLSQTGISTDATAPKAASMMLASASLYLIIEVSERCASSFFCGLRQHIYNQGNV